MAAVLVACAGAPDDASDEPVSAQPEATDEDEQAGPAPATAPEQEPVPEPEPEPEPEPAYAPPDDWLERGLASAEVARRAVVAVGWRPPSVALRRLEAGWLVAPDMVATSPAVACDALQGTGLRVRTFAGEFRSATVVEEPTDCGGWEPGIALLRLDRPVDAPDWRLRDASALEVGEPLLAIGHANSATAIGGWLVLAGPVVRANDSVVWADIGAPVNYTRVNEFFGGGSAGAALIDIDGALVSILCCEQDWGPQVTLRGSRLAEPLLRRRVVLDEPYFVGGLAPAALERELISAGLG